MALHPTVQVSNPPPHPQGRDGTPSTELTTSTVSVGVRCLLSADLSLSSSSVPRITVALTPPDGGGGQDRSSFSSNDFTNCENSEYYSLDR